jgi:hypothetical protein
MKNTHPAARAATALAIGIALFASVPAWAKLPPPSEEAKAKAAEAAAKAAHNNKVEAYKLCKSMDQVASGYYANAKKAGKEAAPAVATAPCADPGPFVYTPPAAASAPAVTAAAPAAAPAPVKK